MGRELLGELYEAIRRRIETQGEFSLDRGVLEELADEVIDEFMRDGLITDDEDVAALKAELVGRLESELKS